MNYYHTVKGEHFSLCHQDEIHVVNILWFNIAYGNYICEFLRYVNIKYT